MRTIDNRSEPQTHLTAASGFYSAVTQKATTDFTHSGYGTLVTSTFVTREASTDAAEQLTGCCSSLSIDCCNDHCYNDNSSDEYQSYCFDCNDGYTAVEHRTISREAILSSTHDYHGLCISDENLDSFVDSRESTQSLIELMMIGR